MARAHPLAINKVAVAMDRLDLSGLDEACERRGIPPRGAAVDDREADDVGLHLRLRTITYLFPKGLEDAMDVEAEEAARARPQDDALTRGALDPTGAEDSQALAPDGAVLGRRRHPRRLRARHCPLPDASDGAMTRVALTAPNAPFDVTKRLMRDTAALAESDDCRLHTHLVETAQEAAFAPRSRAVDATAADYLEDVGRLNDRVWLAHGIYFDDAEVAKLGRHGVGASATARPPTWCSLFGICRTKELEAAGSPIGLGVDGSASNDNSNLIEAVRHALMIGRLRYDAATVTHRVAFRWGTQGSARCLGRDDIGVIDVRTSRPTSPSGHSTNSRRFSGAGDPIAALVLCGAHAADRVMVKGEWRIEDGVPEGVDLERLRYEHHQASRAFLENL